MIKNVITNQAVATTATSTGGDLDVRRLRTLTVITRLAGTVTPADLTANDPVPYDELGVIMTAGLPPELSVAAAASGADVVVVRRYDVGGVEKIRLNAKNNNAGTLNVFITAFASAEGRA